MASFNDMMKSLNPIRPGTRCGVGVWLETVTEDERDEFNVALNDRTFTGADIHRVMKEMGFGYTISSLRGHRAHECLCRSLTV